MAGEPPTSGASKSHLSEFATEEALQNRLSEVPEYTIPEATNPNYVLFSSLLIPWAVLFLKEIDDLLGKAPNYSALLVDRNSYQSNVTIIPSIFSIYSIPVEIAEVRFPSRMEALGLENHPHHDFLLRHLMLLDAIVFDAGLHFMEKAAPFFAKTDGTISQDDEKISTAYKLICELFKEFLLSYLIRELSELKEDDPLFNGTNGDISTYLHALFNRFQHSLLIEFIRYLQVPSKIDIGARAFESKISSAIEVVTEIEKQTAAYLHQYDPPIIPAVTVSKITPSTSNPSSPLEDSTMNPSAPSTSNPSSPLEGLTPREKASYYAVLPVNPKHPLEPLYSLEEELELLSEIGWRTGNKSIVEGINLYKTMMPGTNPEVQNQTVIFAQLTRYFSYGLDARYGGTKEERVARAQEGILALVPAMLLARCEGSGSFLTCGFLIGADTLVMALGLVGIVLGTFGLFTGFGTAPSAVVLAVGILLLGGGTGAIFPLKNKIEIDSRPGFVNKALQSLSIFERAVEAVPVTTTTFPSPMASSS